MCHSIHMHSDNTSSAPVMFCHDGTTIFYPTGPGRVHMIAIAALADCDSSDEDFADSTARGDVRYLAWHNRLVPAHGTLAPPTWPNSVTDMLADIPYTSAEERDNDFHDLLEQWADWCDRDAARLDSLDGPAPDADAAGILARLRSLVARPPYTLQTVAEVVAAITEGQPGVAA